MKKEIIVEFKNHGKSVNSYFDKCSDALIKLIEQGFIYENNDYYWSKLPDDLKKESEKLINELITIGQKLAALCKKSILVDEADVRELSHYIKEMRAAIRLRRYNYLEPDVIHDEGTVLGFRPATQSEYGPLNPRDAKSIYNKTAMNVIKIYELIDEMSIIDNSSTSLKTNISKYRPNTAFIMMWMDATNPELEDVRDTVFDIFDKFDIKAIRADEIEHEGMITQRIIDEIKTSEFLFSDLTGSRPNVYYEVGFAHALGKRVILFRKKGTGLHFDLAGYNCPEYENLRDLKQKLTRRLEYLTNKRIATG